MPNNNLQTSFNDYYGHTVNTYLSNPQRLDYKSFCDRTERAKLPLNCANEAQFYTTAYAMQHYQSMMTLLTSRICIHSVPLSLNVVDYGCGQGVATLALLDDIASRAKAPIKLNIHLLEPSLVVLNIAKELIARRATALGFDLTLTSQNTDLANVNLPAHIKQSNDTTLHIFSNVLDVVAVQLSLNSVVNQINQLQGNSLVLATAPNYSESYKGFCQLSAMLTHNANPTIYSQDVEHYSYRVVQNRWQTALAKTIYMSLDVNDDYYNHQVA